MKLQEWVDVLGLSGVLAFSTVMAFTLLKILVKEEAVWSESNKTILAVELVFSVFVMLYALRLIVRYYRCEAL